MKVIALGLLIALGACAPVAKAPAHAAAQAQRRCLIWPSISWCPGEAVAAKTCPDGRDFLIFEDGRTGPMPADHFGGFALVEKLPNCPDGSRPRTSGAEGPHRE